jgi:hypothetical protein
VVFKRAETKGIQSFFAGFYQKKSFFMFFLPFGQACVIGGVR